jgi:hypothetical protein
MMSEHLLQPVDDPPIRTTVEVRKRQRLSAKFVRAGPLDDSGATPPASTPQGCAFPRKNRCDLVTYGWKVLLRQGARRESMNLFAAGTTDCGRFATAIKLVLNQFIKRAGAAVPGTLCAAICSGDEQRHVNTCRILRLPTAAFRSNDDRG